MQWAISRTDSLFQRVGRKVQGINPKQQEHWEKPFLSARRHSEVQTRGNRKVLSAGNCSQWAQRGWAGWAAFRLPSDPLKCSSKPSHSSSWASHDMAHPKRNRHWILCLFPPLGHLVLGKALHSHQWRALLKISVQHLSWFISWLREKCFIKLFLLILTISVSRSRDAKRAQPVG